jgi:ribulose-5-phosphate 4-epimerase/fuculose-1-phosphate aldolase
MSNVTQMKSATRTPQDEWQLRVDLAAAFRLAAEFDWHESVANHFSCAVSADGKKFLMNPLWQHFSTIKASDLLLLDSGDEDTMKRPNAPDPSAWCIHGAMHRRMAQARVVLHLHPVYAAALAGLKDPELKPIDQNTARFYNRIAVDLDYGGIADDTEEGLRLVRVMGNKSRMMMGNHGLLVTGATVAEAFEDLYYLERACRTLVIAYSTGQPLNLMSPEVAEKVAVSTVDYAGMAPAFFKQMKQMLDKKDPSYAQ